MKKKKSAPRVRRDPYQRSLDHATKRLDKALVELAACQLQMQALNQEIPYLQTVIRALTPPDARETNAAIVAAIASNTRPSLKSPIAVAVPSHLEKYIGKSNGEPPQNENDFLKDDIVAPGEWHDGR